MIKKIIGMVVALGAIAIMAIAIWHHDRYSSLIVTEERAPMEVTVLQKDSLHLQ